MILGLDLGYSYTKDNQKHIFKSAITKEDQITSNAINIEIENQKYYVGIGNEIIDIDKTEKELTKILFLTDLALTGENDFYIVTGLPISQYKKQKTKLKEILLKYNNTQIRYNNQIKNLLIRDITIFPQGAGALYSANIMENALIIDIGGRTIDIALFEYIDNYFNLIKSDSLYKGMLILYGNIIKAINNHFNLTLEISNAYSIITKGLKINGEIQNLNFLQSIIVEYFQPILSYLILNYPVRTTDVYLCGGGSILLNDTIKACIPNTTILNDSQFSNAKGFYNVGKNIYNKYENDRKCNNWITK